MTPKEKAEELVNSFYKYANSTDFNHLTGDFYTNNLLWLNNAKKCALICVYEILGILERVDTYKNYFETLPDMYYASSENELNYWNEVKQEIEKL